MTDNSTSSHETSELARREEFLASRKSAGLVVDVETCEFHWGWGETFDPYGIEPDLPEELRQIQSWYFVRSDESEGWVCTCDLPEDKRRAVDARIKRGDADDDFPFVRAAG